MARVKKRTFSAGQMIFEQGDPGDCAYLVENGQVQIFLNGSNGYFPLTVFSEGEVFGEMALIDNQSRSAAAKAITDCSLIVVTREQLIERMGAADPVVRILLRVLLQRIRVQNGRLAGNSLEAKDLLPIKIDQTSQIFERIQIENQIYSGLMNEEFEPHYQPIYATTTLKMIGCEALARWTSKSSEKDIAPSVFMDVIENSSVIRPLGRMILERCFSDFKQIAKAYKDCPDFFLSVNISGKQFDDPDFVQFLEGVREKCGVKPNRIKLEVTERVILEGPQSLMALKQCYDLGYKIALDDFGTGFSGLQYLVTIPLHELKIDRSFVHHLHSKPKNVAVVESLVFLAKQMDLSLIAEGIENEEELHILSRLGVPMVQGYLFSKAVPLKQLLKMPRQMKVSMSQSA